MTLPNVAPPSPPLAVLGIAEVASMALLEQMVTPGGSMDEIKRAVRGSVYWPAFCDLAGAGSVPSYWLREPLATAVVGWAKADREGHRAHD